MTEFATLGEALDAAKIKQAGKASRKHFAIREQHKPAKPLSPDEIAAKYHKRCYRSGKTYRNESENTRRAKKEELASYTRWCSDHASNAANTATAVTKFPKHCNGKRARALRGVK